MALKRLGLVFLLTLTVGCATVQPNPTSSSQATARQHADRALREMDFGVTAIGAVRPLVNTVPLPAATKDTIQCGVVKIVGRSPQTPAADLALAEVTCGGPLPVATEAPLGVAARELVNVTSCASLGTTLRRVATILAPFLAQLESSADAALRYAALAIRAGLAFTLSGGATCSA